MRLGVVANGSVLLLNIEGGHIFCGSGGELGAKGVAILVHRKWASRLVAFNRVNDRVAYLAIYLSNIKLRIATAYFLHSGYGDANVQSRPSFHLFDH